MSVEFRTVEIGNNALDCFSFGAGARKLVILPGLSIRGILNYAPLVAMSYREFSDLFTVYVFDKPRAIPPGYGIENMTDDTALAAERLGLDEFRLFGASFGGMMAMLLAIRHPRRVSRLALGCTSARIEPERFAVLAEWIDLAEKRDRAGLFMKFGQAVYPPEIFAGCRDALLHVAEMTTDDDLERFAALSRSARNFDIAQNLDAIRCPTLAVGARDDNVLGAEATETIAGRMAFREDFTMHMYESGYGHAAYDTAPDFKRRLLEFIRR